MTAIATEPALFDLPPLETPHAPAADGSIRRIEERVEYANEFITVQYDDVVFPDGAQSRYSRVTTGTGLGVVAVPYANYRGLPYLGLVRQYRYPTGEFTLEFPRGGSDDLSLSEAARELVEETGLTYDSARRLGTIRPDTGILDTRIAVWQTNHLLEGLDNSHVEEETGATFRWYRHAEVMGLIRSGKITCGITLSALTLIDAAGSIHSVL